MTCGPRGGLIPLPCHVTPRYPHWQVLCLVISLQFGWVGTEAFPVPSHRQSVLATWPQTLDRPHLPELALLGAVCFCRMEWGWSWDSGSFYPSEIFCRLLSTITGKPQVHTKPGLASMCTGTCASQRHTLWPRECLGRMAERLALSLGLLSWSQPLRHHGGRIPIFHPDLPLACHPKWNTSAQVSVR